MQPKLCLEKDPKIAGEAEKIDTKKSQELIGSLLHLSVFNCSDMACSAVHFVAIK